MARLTRLAVPGQAHYVIQPGHGARRVFTDDADRALYRSALATAAGTCNLQLLAYALLDHEVQLVVTPSDGTGLSRAMQAIGRSYVSAYNRRHESRGTLWSGRFRAAVLEPGAVLLHALVLVDSQPGGHTSAAARLGDRNTVPLAMPHELWRLGNTPFEREAAYRHLLSRPGDARAAQDLRHAAMGGWALGSSRFIQALATEQTRQLQPLRRGRRPEI